MLHWGVSRRGQEGYTSHRDASLRGRICTGETIQGLLFPVQPAAPVPHTPALPTLSMVGRLRTTSNRRCPTCRTRPAAHASPLGIAGSIGLLQQRRDS